MRDSSATTLRLVEPEDIAPLAGLMEAWNVGLDRGHEADLLEQLTLVAERDGRVIGCISALVGPSEVAYVDNLVVKPAEGSPRLTFDLLSAIECLLARLGWRSIQACISVERPELVAYARRLGYRDYGLHHVLGKQLD